MSTQPSAALPVPESRAAISFQGVSKQYSDGTLAVRELNMNIEKGKITVFVGPSGCGKTTTLRMINRMVEPSTGAILINGKNNAEVNPPQLRRSMGYVMQAAGLLPNRTVLANIATVPRLDGVSKAQARTRSLELMDVVGLDRDLAKRYPVQLSGGQSQRVGVARALAADPPILLMDEPFSAVDPLVRSELQAEMLHLQRDLGKTVVFVTHDIDEAVLLGDWIAVFGKGEVEQFTTPEQLLREPASEYVAQFIGHDRGFRHLSFFPASSLPLTPAPTALVGQAPVAPWTLATTDQGKPLGWYEDANFGQNPPCAEPEGVGSLDRSDAKGSDDGAAGIQHSAQSLHGGEDNHGEDNHGATQDGDIHTKRIASAITAESLIPGGSLLHPDQSLRRALDSALSSPAGCGVAVDENGSVRGVFSAEQVVRASVQALARERGQLDLTAVRGSAADADKLAVADAGDA